MIKLGDKVRDSVTGFTGIVTARAEYLHGEVRCQVEPNGYNEPRWIDEARLVSQMVEWSEPSDPLAAFVTACCLTGLGLIVPVSALWAAYQDWCQRTGERYPLGRVRFAESIIKSGFTQKRLRVGNEIIQHWQGLRVRKRGAK